MLQGHPWGLLRLRCSGGSLINLMGWPVVCVSSRNVTSSVVHGLEQFGIPVLGPIWDS